MMKKIACLLNKFTGILEFYHAERERERGGGTYNSNDLIYYHYYFFFFENSVSYIHVILDACMDPRIQQHFDYY